ncbi:MAG TPA: MBOAT family protein [Bryobacteraceae bacterium]|jgi:alginate O-acetyltransferase complex protein AlgI|nr:MBOAT family protein [Bryobacteraceae bacterium]
MVFSSIIFLCYFFPLFLISFYATGRSKYTVLLFSLLFYAWGEPFYVALMVASILVNYCIGWAIEESRAAGDDRRWLICGIAFNLAPLVFFKYTHFIGSILTATLRIPDPTARFGEIALPLGISFYTFHAISYLVDVYRRDVAAERRLVDLAVYISMFPQLIAGPIIRFKNIAKELHQPVVSFERTAQGTRWLLIGLGQKVLIANVLAVPADAIFSLPPERLSAVDAWIGTICYTLQIYYDFCGYSTMAVGLGLMIGLQFPWNFNYPYWSTSVTEFWRRWHMTLSQWFRDYVYIPLGGNRGARSKTYLNLLIVFLLCGIWHGAGWTFVVWGLLHGAFLMFERAGFAETLKRMPLALCRAYTMLVVMLGWVLFRSGTFHQALQHVRAMAGLGVPYEFGPPISRFLHNDVLIAGTVAILASGPWLGSTMTVFGERLAFGPLRVVSVGVLLSVLVLSLMSLAGGAYNPFIYFRF